MGVEKSLEGRRPIMGDITSWFCLELREQKCLKAEYGTIKDMQWDRIKRKQ